MASANARRGRSRGSRVALRSLSLCSGIGGLDLGLARWCRTVCYVERDSFAASVLVARMEEAELDRAPIWNDLRSFDGRAWRGAVDLVVGGYPCQPFSAAGKRQGANDERHLWPEIRRILEEVAPPLAFFENVRGHLSLGFADVLGDLAALGFDAEWGVLAASDVGAPHRRDRLFILAHAQGHDGRLLLCERGSRESGDEPRGCREDVADAKEGRSTRILGAARGRRTGSTDGCGVLGDAEREDRRGQPDSPERSALWGTSADGAGEGLGDSDDTRLEIRGPRAEPGSFPAAWPPGPANRAGWEAWIAQGGPQPVLRRGVDGPAAFVDRADRLQCLGNAVVPAQAEAAFALLAERVMRTRGSGGEDTVARSPSDVPDEHRRRARTKKKARRGPAGAAGSAP